MVPLSWLFRRYRYSRLRRLPSDAGIVPVSRLDSSFLHEAQPWQLVRRLAHHRSKACVQVSEGLQRSDGRRDGAIQVVVVHVAAPIGIEHQNGIARRRIVVARRTCSRPSPIRCSTLHTTGCRTGHRPASSVSESNRCRWSSCRGPRARCLPFPSALGAISNPRPPKLRTFERCPRAIQACNNHNSESCYSYKVHHKHPHKARLTRRHGRWICVRALRGGDDETRTAAQQHSEIAMLFLSIHPSGVCIRVVVN